MAAVLEDVAIPKDQLLAAHLDPLASEPQLAQVDLAVVAVASEAALVDVEEGEEDLAIAEVVAEVASEVVVVEGTVGAGEALAINPTATVLLTAPLLVLAALVKADSEIGVEEAADMAAIDQAVVDDPTTVEVAVATIGAPVVPTTNRWVAEIDTAMVVAVMADETVGMAAATSHASAITRGTATTILVSGGDTECLCCGIGLSKGYISSTSSACINEGKAIFDHPFDTRRITAFHLDVST